MIAFTSSNITIQCTFFLFGGVRGGLDQTSQCLEVIPVLCSGVTSGGAEESHAVLGSKGYAHARQCLNPCVISPVPSVCNSKKILAYIPALSTL